MPKIAFPAEFVEIGRALLDADEILINNKKTTMSRIKAYSGSGVVFFSPNHPTPPSNTYTTFAAAYAAAIAADPVSPRVCIDTQYSSNPGNADVLTGTSYNFTNFTIEGMYDRNIGDYPTLNFAATVTITGYANITLKNLYLNTLNVSGVAPFVLTGNHIIYLDNANIQTNGQAPFFSVSAGASISFNAKNVGISTSGVGSYGAIHTAGGTIGYTVLLGGYIGANAFGSTNAGSTLNLLRDGAVMTSTADGTLAQQTKWTLGTYNIANDTRATYIGMVDPYSQETTVEAEVNALRTEADLQKSSVTVVASGTSYTLASVNVKKVFLDLTTTTQIIDLPNPVAYPGRSWKIHKKDTGTNSFALQPPAGAKVYYLNNAPASGALVGITGSVATNRPCYDLWCDGTDYWVSNGP